MNEIEKGFVAGLVVAAICGVGLLVCFYPILLPVKNQVEHVSKSKFQ
jgi:hypothetical protein